MSSEQPPPTSAPGADLEYDLAHEATENGEAVAPTDDGHDHGREAQPEAVATGTPEYDGDYSYDLAHDVPRE